MEKVLKIDVDLSDEVSGIQEIAKVLRPEWDIKSLKYERFSKGLLCRPILVYESTKAKDAIVLKQLHPQYTGQKDQIFKLCQFLRQENLGPKILGMFNHGICQEYVEGEALDWGSERVNEPEVWPKIAKELARWHDEKVYQRALEFGVRKTDILFLDVENEWDNVLAHLNLAQFRNQFPTKSVLLEETRSLEEEMLKRGEFIPRFGHMDPNFANIILTNSDRGVELLDYDFTGINYRETDLSWYFAAFSEYLTPGCDHIPGKDYEMKFLRVYLQAQKHTVTEEEVTKLFKSVQVAKLFVYLRTVIIQGFTQASHGGRQNFIPKVLEMWKRYPDIKRRILAANRA